MLDDRGNRVKEAGPSVPVEVLGLSGIPEAGEIFEVVADEKTARYMVREAERRGGSDARAGVTLVDIYSRMETGQARALNLIVKTDVQGAGEAVRSALESLGTVLDFV